MTDQEVEYIKNPELAPTTMILVGFYSAIITTIVTVITFVFAMTAIPISGANCLGDCIEYPYLDTLAQYPKDYIWMYLAIVLILAYVVLMGSIHSFAPQQKKILSQIGLSFAIIAALVLLMDYYVQFSVIPVSLMNGETGGITLLTQYNPHGIFIALEELGYLMMSLSYLFVGLAFVKKSRLEAAIRWIFIISFFLTIVSLIIISVIYGLERQDRFEAAVISIDWLVLIVNGILLSVLFRRQLMAERKM